MTSKLELLYEHIRCPGGKKFKYIPGKPFTGCVKAGGKAADAMLEWLKKHPEKRQDYYTLGQPSPGKMVKERDTLREMCDEMWYTIQLQNNRMSEWKTAYDQLKKERDNLRRAVDTYGEVTKMYEAQSKLLADIMGGIARLKANEQPDRSKLNSLFNRFKEAFDGTMGTNKRLSNVRSLRNSLPPTGVNNNKKNNIRRRSI
jgi:hypothetical protein